MLGAGGLKPNIFSCFGLTNVVEQLDLPCLTAAGKPSLP